ncbi:MAG: hypothetical protein F4204_01855, partial [Rhodospirillaceae bacterium]|nr:hypothetical protein [Rhodospirillaceae bacterium]
MADRIGPETRNPPIHAEVLAAAQLLCGTADWTFRLVDVVRALSHLNERSVRTHVASRCCENAPENHAHRWPYFRRVRRGVYEILPAYRGSVPGDTVTYARSATGDRTGDPLTARDSAQSEGKSTIHAVV